MTTYKFTVADHDWSHEFNVEAVDHNEAIQLIGWALRSFSEFPKDDTDVLKRIERLEAAVTAQAKIFAQVDEEDARVARLEAEIESLKPKIQRLDRIDHIIARVYDQ